MKKEDLVALGLTEEQIAEIQKLNGIDIKREQDKAKEVETERDELKGQLDIAQETLKGFENVNVEELQGKIEELNKELETKSTEYQSQIAERDFNSLLDGHITSFGARNSKAVKALLDLETLKASKNQEADIKSAIEACQKDNDYLFGSNEPINNPTGPTGGKTPGIDATTIALRAAMGLTEKE